MASTASDDFEKDWTFVDRDGKIDIQARKNSVSYCKSPSTKNDALVSQTEFKPRDDSESEPEFEVLSAFQCQSPSTVDPVRLQAEEGVCLVQNLQDNSKVLKDREDPGLIRQNDCNCAASDGLMIISNHFCPNESSGFVGGISAEDSLSSECIQGNDPSSDISSHTADAWQELPQLSESGSLSFPIESKSLEDDNDVEPIPEEDLSGDFVSLVHEPSGVMGESRSSVFSFDSDLFNQTDLDEDANEEEEHSGVAAACSGDNEDRDAKADKNDNVVTTVGTCDASPMFLDVPTLFVLLGVTTALGFFIGYGMSLYIGSQDLKASGNIKRPGPKTSSFPVSSETMEPLDEISLDFLDQLTMWKVEDHLDRQKEQDAERQPGDLFDTKALHEKLQQRHFKLMSLHESMKQRLRTSKLMSWFWRLRYEKEKSKGGGGNEWNKALQEQLEHMEQLYLHEKHIADLWRRMNENTKLHQVEATSDIKFDRYWRDFLSRWRKNAERNPGLNNSKKVTEIDEKPKEVTARDEVESKTLKAARIRDKAWSEFINRWTKDSQSVSNGEVEVDSSSKNQNCASGNRNKRTDASLLFQERSLTSLSQHMDVSSLLSPVFANVASEVDVTEQETRVKIPEGGEASEFLHRGNKERSVNQLQDTNEINKDRLHGLRSSQDFFSPWLGTSDKAATFLEDNNRAKRKQSELLVNPAPKKTSVKIYSVETASETPKREESNVLAVEPKLTSKNNKIKYRKDQQVKSYQGYFTSRRCAWESLDVPPRVLKPRKILEAQNEGINTSAQSQQLLLRKQKRILRNLTQFRGEEIRKHRIQRRELKKKEKEMNERVKEAKRLLSELKQERRAIKTKKAILRRSWRKLKKEKKTFSREVKVYKNDKRRLEEFSAKLKAEKSKLKKLKGEFKDKRKELLAKEKEGKKLKKKLEAEKAKEVERLRAEIVQEKEKLRKQHRSLKALKKAARKKLKKWLKEVKKLKRKENKGRNAKLAKKGKKARKKFKEAENERQRKTEYDAVVREQAKYDTEKRRRKGEFGLHEKEKAAENMKQDDDAERDGAREESNRGYFFGKQFENVKQWFSSVHKKTLEKQRAYWRGLLEQSLFRRKAGSESSEVKDEGHNSHLANVKEWLSSVHKKTLETQKTYLRSLIPERLFKRYGENLESNEDNHAELNDEDPRHTKSSREDKEEVELGPNGPGNTVSENGKENTVTSMKELEKLGNEQRGQKKSNLRIRKSELTTVPEHKALTDFVNLTFDVDLVKILVREHDKRETEGKSTSGVDQAADTRAFVIVSGESSEVDFNRENSESKRKKSPKKPKKPEDRPWFVQGPIVANEFRSEPRGLHHRKVPEGPIAPEGFRPSHEEWHKDRFGMERKQVVPHGPKIPKDERPARAYKTSMRKQDDATGKVCTFQDSDEEEVIPPPDWVFRRAKERARGRADQRSVPWYEKRAEDRSLRRNEDEHVTQFPYGPWYHRRAQDRSVQRRRDKHATQFPCDVDWKPSDDLDSSFCHRPNQNRKRKSKSQAKPCVQNSKRSSDERFTPWYDRRAQNRKFQRKKDKHRTKFRHGRKRKRNQEWYFGQANDRASQGSDHGSWDWGEPQHWEDEDSWNFEPVPEWMPRGPYMDERRSQ